MDPAFLFYPGDYLRDTQTLSEKTQVAYDRIMCEHMRNICISKQQLKFFTKKLNESEIDELMFLLMETKDGFQIPWVAESIIKRKAYSNSRRQNRLTKEDKICKTYDSHMENENENENRNNIKGAEINKKIPFETFWNLYDKKSDRKVCEPKWNKLSLIDQQAIIEYLPGYIQSTPNKVFRKDPETFLNRRSWENELIKPLNNVTHNAKSKDNDTISKKYDPYAELNKETLESR